MTDPSPRAARDGDLPLPPGVDIGAAFASLEFEHPDGTVTPIAAAQLDPSPVDERRPAPTIFGRTLDELTTAMSTEATAVCPGQHEAARSGLLGHANATLRCTVLGEVARVELPDNVTPDELNGWLEAALVAHDLQVARATLRTLLEHIAELTAR